MTESEAMQALRVCVARVLDAKRARDLAEEAMDEASLELSEAEDELEAALLFCLHAYQ